MFGRANKTLCRASQLQRFVGKVNKEQEKSENGTNFRVDVEGIFLFIVEKFVSNYIS